MLRVMARDSLTQMRIELVFVVVVRHIQPAYPQYGWA